jgi:hypothetical protein
MTPGALLEGLGPLILGSQTTSEGSIAVRNLIHNEISNTNDTILGGSHRPLPLRGDWQGPMTSLLDPGVPWSTLEGVRGPPERVPRAQNSGIFGAEISPPGVPL